MAITRGRWKVEAGDEVWAHYGRDWRLVKVEKVGSKLAHLFDKGAYYLADGRRRDGYSGSFQTQEHRAEDLRRLAVLKALRETYGIDFGWTHRQEWPVAALESLVEAIEKIDTEHQIYKKN